MHWRQITNQQKAIFLFVKNYIKYEKKKIDTANSSVCYFVNYGDFISASLLKIKFYGIKYYPKFLLNIFKNLYSTINIQNYDCTKILKQKGFKYLLISHVSKTDFLKNGSYYDKYFSLQSNNHKNTLFFLNSIDGFSPKNLQKNIIIFKQREKKLSLQKLLIDLLKFIIENKFSIKKIFHYFNFNSQFSKIIFPHILKLIKINKFKKIFLFYEAQPYQNYFIKKIKDKYKIPTIGFYHSGLLPVHSSLVHREGAPDKLLISGSAQKKYCEKYLGWPKKKVKNIRSFRYSKKIPLEKKDAIFLPYSFSRPNFILKSLKFFFKDVKDYSLPKFIIKNHPATYSSKKHLKLIKKIKNIIKTQKKKFTNKSKNISIFIGSTTSVVLALEQKKEIIHICEDPIFDCYNDQIWNELTTTKIGNNIFKYKLKKNKKMLKLTNDNKSEIRTYLK